MPSASYKANTRRITIHEQDLPNELILKLQTTKDGKMRIPAQVRKLLGLDNKKYLITVKIIEIEELNGKKC